MAHPQLLSALGILSIILFGCSDEPNDRTGKPHTQLEQEFASELKTVAKFDRADAEAVGMPYGSLQNYWMAAHVLAQKKIEAPALIDAINSRVGAVQITTDVRRAVILAAGGAQWPELGAFEVVKDPDGATAVARPEGISDDPWMADSVPLDYFHAVILATRLWAENALDAGQPDDALDAARSLMIMGLQFERGGAAFEHLAPIAKEQCTRVLIALDERAPDKVDDEQLEVFKRRYVTAVEP